VLRPVLGSLVIATVTLGIAFEGNAEFDAAVAAAYVLCSIVYAAFAWAEHRSAGRSGEAMELDLPVEVAGVVLVVAPLMIAAIYGAFFAMFEST